MSVNVIQNNTLKVSHILRLPLPDKAEDSAPAQEPIRAVFQRQRTIMEKVLSELDENHPT